MGRKHFNGSRLRVQAATPVRAGYRRRPSRGKRGEGRQDFASDEREEFASWDSTAYTAPLRRSSCPLRDLAARAEPAVPPRQGRLVIPRQLAATHQYLAVDQHVANRARA